MSTIAFCDRDVALIERAIIALEKIANKNTNNKLSKDFDCSISSNEYVAGVHIKPHRLCTCKCHEVCDFWRTCCDRVLEESTDK